MARAIPSLLLIIVSSFMMVMFSCSLSQAYESGDSYVQDACSVTRYRNLCIQTLAPFANTAKRSPTIWARAGVSVTIGEAKKVSVYLEKLKRKKRGNQSRGRNRVALLDCLETIQEALNNLHKSLYVLRKISVGDFVSQIEDITTWVSAAETDEETCLDGFDGVKKGNQAKSLQKHVLNLKYMTSNALALVNKLATTGPERLTLDLEKFT